MADSDISTSTTTVQDLIGSFVQHPHLETVLDQIQKKSKAHLKGLIGSGASLFFEAIYRNTQQGHLVVLEDKEEAAYFFNDLQSLDKKRKHLAFFPSTYHIPYQEETTENANILMRAESLQLLASRKNFVVVTHPAALAEQVVTKKKLAENTLLIKKGDGLSVSFINEFLMDYDFHRVDYVYEPGQFAIRGGIVDIFSYSNEWPYRIELFDDEVETIRTFNPEDQLSIQSMNEAVVIPNVQDKILRESRGSILDFIPANTCLWMSDTTLTAHKIDTQLEKAKRVYEKLSEIINHMPPEDLYTSGEQFLKGLDQFPLMEFGAKASKEVEITIDFKQKAQPSFNKNFDIFWDHLEEQQENGFHNVVVCSNASQAERLYAIYNDQGKTQNFTTVSLGLHSGFSDPIASITCYTDHQLFERYHRYKLKEGFRKSKQALTIKELNSLQPGDYVTHIDHGVGKFSGLEKIEANGKLQEAIRLEYSGGDILYVSIHSLHRIAKFAGKEGTQPKVNKLGSPAWQNLKKKTKSRVIEVAFDLIQLYAKRKAAKGFSFTPDGYLQTELEASFIYEDTPDQLKATQDVKQDMEAESPMDRLICGDVGFGKTEVAIRAAFKAATDGKQVAVLVPTTVLSLQHYKSFKKRLKDFPVRVSYISRLRSTKENKDALEQLKTGEIDIIIGTHKLIGKQVQFKDLGLLIIDEEQKFGVAVKDKLKTLKANIDCLTLTATPIPRTLQFSLMGARDLSIIKTPPPNRHPVQTEIRAFNEEWIRDAISYEIERGGQVYFVHNRVQNIQEVAGMLQRLLPDARIVIGHGQMEGKKLEEVMVDFTDGLYDILVATTIIESGIDITNANTMIVNNAQNFGLSDLHQLRGRVGRSNKKAFCYLVAQPMHMLPDASRKRLQALEQFSDLGSGMDIAMRDLDIRGAGDMLGGEQSGFIAEIGFETYTKILNEAIKELKDTAFKDVFKGEKLDENQSLFVEDCVIETDFEILIPDHYVNEIAERLSLYKDLDHLIDEEALKDFENNLVDRFGPIPQETHELIDTVRLRWLAQEVGFEKLVLKKGKMLGYFIPQENSAYFQSEAFTKVLQFIQAFPNEAIMKQKNEKLYLVLENVNSIASALQLLLKISGK